mgnify:FL=1
MQDPTNFPLWLKYVIVASSAFIMGKMLFEGTKPQKSAVVDELLIERVMNGRIYGEDVYNNNVPEVETVINLTDLSSLDDKSAKSQKVLAREKDKSETDDDSKMSLKKITAQAGEPYVIIQMNDDDRKKKIKRFVAPQSSGNN